MSSRDIDSVKTKLRELWTQYSGPATAGGSSGGPGDAGTRGPAAGSEETAVEEMLVFPSYAFRDERLKVWRVQVRGWGFCRNPSTRRVRLSAAVLRRFIRVPAGGESDRVLLERISYLFAAQPQSCDMAKVAMAGIVEPAAFELHTHPHPAAYPSDRPPPPPTAVSLLDAPLVLASEFDPRSPPTRQQQQQQPASGHLGHTHDRLVPGPHDSGGGRTIMQKALQIDAFAWQNLALVDGQFQGEILVGFNELEWLLQSHAGGKPSSGGRRLIELRGKLFGWTDAQTITGLVHLVEPQGISVVSDIDDTIKASNITAEKRIVLETVFAQPLQAVPGMAALYRGWYERGCEFHYVSNSPWQLYPSLDGFFHQNRFPPGSAHLRSFDPSDLLSIKNYTGTPQLKRDTIERLFAAFPQRKYVLVGDSGEQDLETYTELARRFPDRIIRIYIRDLFAPMTVPSVTTDTPTAGNTINNGGLVPIGMVPPRSSDDDDDDLMRFPLSDEDDRPQPQQPVDRAKPVPPPKPAGLQSTRPLPSSSRTSPVPPPKPPRKAAAPTSHLRTDSSSSNSSGAAGMAMSSTFAGTPMRRRDPPPVPPRNRSSSANMPGGWTAGAAGPVDNMPLEPPPGLPGSETAMERLEQRAQQLRGLAQQWMAFYAQQFYVAPTRSFLRYAALFLPMIESNMRIIDYDSIHAESLYGSTNNSPSGAGTPLAAGPQPGPPVRPLDIPEPPPPEAQLVRSERRLQLWKRFVAATRGLPPDLCRLFVDAADIDQDAELPALFDRYAGTQL
ncbi:hypothetical protein H4R19_000867 [Coemansia spiralis]|nr:hypothetical protein H4R19_000867 [Coemansia spiralis]